MNLTKLSKKRLIISGPIVELYEYGLPYSYNHEPFPNRGRASSSTQGTSERREDNLWFVRAQIRRLVDANVKRLGYEPVFLTFTFAENITSVEDANKMFSDFIERLNFHYSTRFAYLTVVEFQKRGAVHYHCIFFNMALEIEENERKNRVIAKLWGHGFVDIERVRSAKRVGPYVCKYLDKAVHDKRLRGKKAFFTSRGLLRPRLLRDEATIDSFLARSTLDLEHSVEYDSKHYSKVSYKQYNARSNSSV